MNALFDRYRRFFNDAPRAPARREVWSRFAEVPSANLRGETARADRQAAFVAIAERVSDLSGRRVVPRGSAPVIGCRTVPNRNSRSGPRISLATGNRASAKAHLAATLLLALTIRVAKMRVRFRSILGALHDIDENLILPTVAFAGVGVTLTGNTCINQSAAVGDLDVSGANPAGNASLTDAAFVAMRFRDVLWRRPRAA